MIRSFVLLSALLITTPVTAQPSTPSLADAMSHYRLNRIVEARSGYQALSVSSEASPSDRAAAHRELGRIAWLIDADTSAAIRSLEVATAIGEDRCQTGELQVRVLRDAGRFDAARRSAEQALPTCLDPVERGALGVQLLNNELDAADRLGGAARMAAVRRAQAAAGALNAEGAASLEGSKARLQLALLLGDGNAALKAWRDYFWLTEANAPQALGPYRDTAGDLFLKAAEPTARPADQAALVDMLVRAGFAEAARRFAAAVDLPRRGASQPLWRKAARYLTFRDAILKDALLNYRHLARRTGDGADFETTIERRLIALTGASDLKSAWAAAYQDFGLFGVGGRTGGYPSLHVGHAAQDQRRQMELFGRKAEVRFVVLDNMLSNGFESWLWDGRGGAGGWAFDGANIVQVRTRYAQAPVIAWSLVGDTPARRREEQKIIEEAAADIVAARSPGVRYLPSLNRRLQLQAVDQIAARARSGLKPGDDLRTAFLAEYLRVNVHQSIDLHEGRHVLDQAAKAEHGELSSDELEYRAKLTELAFGEVPRLSMQAFSGTLIGGSTSHGRGNERVMQAMVAWAESHADEIAGYDRALPAQPQLHKLTDEQIRQVGRSLDPWTPRP